VTDSEGNVVDLSEFVRPAAEETPEEAPEEAAADVIPSDDPAAAKF
jgi:trigger factor